MHFRHCLTTLKGQIFSKIKWGIICWPRKNNLQLFFFKNLLKKKILSAYMEITLNGEKCIKIEHISVNMRSTWDKFKILSFYLIYVWLRQKTIPRYCTMPIRNVHRMQEKIINHTEVLIRIIKIRSRACKGRERPWQKDKKNDHCESLNILEKSCARDRGINTAIPRREDKVSWLLDCWTGRGTEFDSILHKIKKVEGKAKFIRENLGRQGLQHSSAPTRKQSTVWQSPRYTNS